MLAQKVEAVCSHLSAVLKQAIRKKILKVPPDAKEYLLGEALVFWVADWLTGTQIVDADQIRLILEEFTGDITKFGASLDTALRPDNADTVRAKRLSLPSAKLGFLDRWHVCMDGVEFFLDLKTGERVETIDYRPLETIAFNLTAIYIRYVDLVRLLDMKAVGDTQIG